MTTFTTLYYVYLYDTNAADIRSALGLLNLLAFYLTILELQLRLPGVVVALGLIH